MSEIPFVTLLGDEIEDAARRAQTRTSHSQRRGRFVAFGVLGALILTGTAAATGLFSSADETQSVTPVSCYTTANSKSSPVIEDAAPETDEIGTLTPVELCRRTLAQIGAAVPDELVACAGDVNVSVIPGRNAADCSAAGLRPLTPGYVRAQQRTVQLEREILRLEAAADCIAPAQLADRVNAVLQRSGWTGWTAEVRSAGSHDACGTVSALGGGGQRTFGGAYDTARRLVLVMPQASRKLTDLMFSRTGLAGALITSTGARCYTIDQLREHVRTLLSAKGVAGALNLKPHTFPKGALLSNDDGRMTRYEEGCAIAVSVELGHDDHSVTVQAWIKPDRT